MEFLTDPQLEDAISSLKRRLIVGQNISGPALGIQALDVLRQRGITQDLKRFGGLRSFVQKFLPDYLQVDDATDMYTVCGDGDHVPGWAAVDGSSRLFWDLFNNPRKTGRFALINSTLIATGGDQQPPPGAISISPMTDADYVEIARGYSASRNNPLELEGALSSDGEDTFFKTWVEAVRSLGGNAVKDWETYRVSKVLARLTARVSDAGADDDLAKHFSRELELSQHCARAQTRAKAERLPTAQGERENGGLQSAAYSQILKYAADHLSEDEIRKVCIPIGTVLDALAQS